MAKIKKLDFPNILEGVNPDIITRCFAELFQTDKLVKLLPAIAEAHNAAKGEAETNYNKTFESVKYWLMKEGRVLPEDFNQFWKWYVRTYGNQIDEQGLITITRPMINEFCREAEKQLINETVTPATNTQAPEGETTEQKIRRILEPLREAFDDAGHLDLIVKALAEYNLNGEPSQYHCRSILIKNKDFYKPFFEVHNEVKITFQGIAEVLHKFIYSNNGSRNAIKVTSILQNFKRPEYKSK